MATQHSSRVHVGLRGLFGGVFFGPRFLLSFEWAFGEADTR